MAEERSITVAELVKRIEALEKTAHPPVDIEAAVRTILLRMLMKPCGGDVRRP